jgi:cation transport protein ChaC
MGIAMDQPTEFRLTREALLGGALQRFIAGRGDLTALSEAELLATRRAALALHPPGQDLWVFAYGSLIWNPAFHFAGREKAHLYGYHRQFCLWTPLGRGSPDRPGLMLGLEHGGSCTGVAFRIAAAAIEVELEAIWRREMVTAAYRPRWVPVHAESGPGRAIAFVINRRHERYARRLPEAEVVRTVAHAEGALGACRDYLFNTVAHLAELGIHDRRLTRLAAAVRACREG